MIRRSFINVARILPVLGAILFFMPSLWTNKDTVADTVAEGTPTQTSDVMVYLFVVWVGLILICIFAYGRLDKNSAEPPQNGGA